MRRWMLFCMLIGVMMGTGCRTAPINYAQAQPDKPGSTFLFLGLWNVFSKGLLDVTDQLNDEGYYARTLSGYAWRDVADQIIEAEAKGQLRRPLVLGGHSLGADKSLKIAQKLEAQGIAVDYVVLLDPTNPPEVPANVKHCHNIFLSQPATDWIPAFRGIAVKRASLDTELINFDVRSATDGPLTEIDFNHFDIESDPDIQTFMVQLIRSRLDGKPAPQTAFPVKAKQPTGDKPPTPHTP